MMDDRNDPNRPLSSDPYVNQPRTTERAGMGWGIPLGIAAFVLIAGMLFFSSGDRTSTVATNNEPSAITRPAPAPSVTPPPATPPAKTQ